MGKQADSLWSSVSRPVIAFFSSLRFTIGLIIGLGAIFMLGLWIPQKGVIDYETYQHWKEGAPILISIIERLGFIDIYRSPLTIALWLCFFINLSLVTWKRLPVVKRRIKIPDPLPGPENPSFQHRAVVRLAKHEDMDGLPKAFGSAGYKYFGAPDRFYAVKNRLSPVASLLFHLSFFLVLLGAVISVYTRFTGSVDLAEGEVFSGEPERYIGSPVLPALGKPPVMRIAINKITPLVEARTPTGLRVTLSDEQSRLHTIDINSPYKSGDLSFVLKDLGLAPLIILHDSAGKELDGAFVKLDIMRGKEDGFSMGGHEFRVRFYPDHRRENGEDRTRSEEFRNPVLTVESGRIGSGGPSGGEGGRTIFRLPYKAGERIPIDGGYLELARLSYWVRFTVVREKGVSLVYAGFLVACCALIWRLVFYRREVSGSSVRNADGSISLQLAFRSEFYRELAEEEFEELKRRLGADDGDRAI